MTCTRLRISRFFGGFIMVDITNANIEKMYELNGLHEVVVQKGNVGTTYNYAL